ncbi:hypothetical protein J6590_078064 [Homalodisca vitripennis]|nr:hypothetical protein J6590_078064 [Homalodisca vitripennis]
MCVVWQIRSGKPSALTLRRIPPQKECCASHGIDLGYLNGTVSVNLEYNVGVGKVPHLHLSLKHRSAAQIPQKLKEFDLEDSAGCAGVTATTAVGTGSLIFLPSRAGIRNLHTLAPISKIRRKPFVRQTSNTTCLQLAQQCLMMYTVECFGQIKEYA